MSIFGAFFAFYDKCCYKNNFNALKKKINLNFVSRYIPHRAGNILPLAYNNQSVNL